jgi:hypothetical protein
MRFYHSKLEGMIQKIKKTKKQIKKREVQVKSFIELKSILAAVEGTEDLEAIEDFNVEDFSIEEFNEMMEMAKQTLGILMVIEKNQKERAR